MKKNYQPYGLIDGSINRYNQRICNTKSKQTRQKYKYAISYPVELMDQYNLNMNVNNELCPKRNCLPCMRSNYDLINQTPCAKNPCFYIDNPIKSECPKSCDLRMEMDPCLRKIQCPLLTKLEARDCCKYTTKPNPSPQKFRSETFNYKGICRDYRPSCCKQKILGPVVCPPSKSDQSDVPVCNPTKPCNEYAATYIYQPTTPTPKTDECENTLVGRYEKFIPFEKIECKTPAPAPINTCYVKKRRCSDFIPTIRQSVFRQEGKRYGRSYRIKSNRSKRRNKLSNRSYVSPRIGSSQMGHSLSPHDYGHDQLGVESVSSVGIRTMSGISPLGGGETFGSINPVTMSNLGHSDSQGSHVVHTSPNISPNSQGGLVVKPQHQMSESPQLYVQLASCMSFEPTQNNLPLNTIKSSPQTITANSVFSIPLSDIEKNLGDCVLGLTHNILVSPGDEMLPTNEPKMNVHVEKHSTTSVRAESLMNAVGPEIPVGGIPVRTINQQSLTDSYNLNSHNQVHQIEFQIIQPSYGNLFALIEPIQIEINQNNHSYFIVHANSSRLEWDNNSNNSNNNNSSSDSPIYDNENFLNSNSFCSAKSDLIREHERREFNFQRLHGFLIKKNRDFVRRTKFIQINQNASTTSLESKNLSQQNTNFVNFDKQAVFVRGEINDHMKTTKTMLDLSSHNMDRTNAYEPFYCVLPQFLKTNETGNQDQLLPKHTHYKPALHGTAKHPLITSNKVTPEAHEILLSIKDIINMIMDDLKALSTEITDHNFRSCSAIAEHLKNLPNMLTLLFDHLHYSPNEYDLVNMIQTLNKLINKIVSDPVSIIFNLIEFGCRLNELSRQLGENLLPEELPKLIHTIQSKLQRLKIGYVTRQYFHIPQSSDDLVAPYRKSRLLARLEKDCGCQVNLLHPEDPRAIYCPSGYRTIEVIYDPETGRHDLFRRRLNQSINPNRQVARLVTTIVHQINDQEYSMKIEDVNELLNCKVRPRYCDVKSIIFSSPRYNQIVR